MTNPSRLCRFQFSLRTLFGVIAIVAVQCAVCLPSLKEWQRLKRIDAIRKTIRSPSNYRVHRVAISSDKVVDAQF